MTIFRKIFLLFCASIALMYYLSTQTNKITDEKIALVYIQKYVQASKELFGYLADGDIKRLNRRAKELGYEKAKIDLKSSSVKVVHDDKVSFGAIKVLKKDGAYFLYMKYLDDSSVFYDKSQIKESEQKERLNYLIIADILLLVIMFVIIVGILKPLKTVSEGIEKFGSGDYSWRLKESKNSDEIAKLTKQFNKMAENLENLIKSRTQLLSDISHELRMPIAKSKLSLEMIQQSKYTDMLKRAINQIDNLTNELLEVERLNSHSVKMEIKKHSIDAVLAEALSKMMIDDEEQIEVEIIQTFECKADINYLSMAIKNLIDNALKYKEEGRVKITIDQGLLEIANLGSPLSKELEYYLQTFTQEDDSRGSKGYGLGLNIVKRVLEYHGFKLTYRHENGYNLFAISDLSI